MKKWLFSPRVQPLRSFFKTQHLSPADYIVIIIVTAEKKQVFFVQL